MSEVLLYGNINSYSAAKFIADCNALTGKNKTIRVNSDGGEVRYGLGMLSKLNSESDITLINDCEANSMAAFAFCYPAKSKMCADYATFGFHRAGYSEDFESDPFLFNDSEKAYLQKTNDALRAAMEGTMDSMEFMKETNCSYDELFSMNGRKEVIINAQTAKKLGLVNEIFQVTPEKKVAISALRRKIEASFTASKTTPTPVQTPKTNTYMTLAEFKSANPDLFKEIVTSERERCEAWAVFADVDPKVVAEGISSDKHISAKIQAEFIRKQISAETVEKIEKNNPEEVKIKADAAKVVTETESEKLQKQAVEAVRKSLNLVS